MIFNMLKSTTVIPSCLFNLCIRGSGIKKVEDEFQPLKVLSCDSHNVAVGYLPSWLFKKGIEFVYLTFGGRL